MNLIGLMPARNEGWVIGLTLRAALLWCDHVIALDHASTDETSDIIDDVTGETGRVTRMTELGAEWSEMEHRQSMLDHARKLKATHVAIVDADEIITGNLLGEIRELVAMCQPGKILQIPMRNMHRSIHQHRCDRSPFGNAICSVSFADAPNLSWRDTNGYPHHHREPFGNLGAYRIYPQQMSGGVMHLQFANWRRLIAKHALYKASERVRFPHKDVADIDRMYSMAPDETGLELADAKPGWWEPYNGLMRYLDINREPWQEEATRRLVEEHGRAKFEGLDLFGVA